MWPKCAILELAQEVTSNPEAVVAAGPCDDIVELTSAGERLGLMRAAAVAFFATRIYFSISSSFSEEVENA